MAHEARGNISLPVSFIQDDDFMPPFWKCNFLLSKHLDFVSYNIDASKTKTCNHNLLHF